MNNGIEAYLSISGIDCEAYTTGADEDGIYQGVKVYQVGGMPISHVMVDLNYDSIQQALRDAELENYADHAEHIKAVDL